MLLLLVRTTTTTTNTPTNSIPDQLTSTPYTELYKYYIYNYPNNASDDLSFRLSRMTSCTSNPAQAFLPATAVVVVLELLSANHYQLANKTHSSTVIQSGTMYVTPTSNSKDHYTDDATGTTPSLSVQSASPAATADTNSALAPSEASSSPS